MGKNEDKDTDVCRDYDGVLRIRQGDAGGAALTCLFVYPINQILYAEMHNLLPWIQFDNTSHLVYDAKVHGAGPSRSFRMRLGDIPSFPPDESCDDCEDRPGTPIPPDNETMFTNVTVLGNGVWKSYFESLNSFDPIDNPCKDDIVDSSGSPSSGISGKPLYDFSDEQVSEGIHLDSKWAVRTWDYGIAGPKKLNLTMKRWYKPLRLRASDIVKRYFRVQPWLKERVEQANPLQKQQRCLAMHVRTTDKTASGGRKIVDLLDYLPYAKAFVKHERKAGREPILYLATDSKKVVNNINTNWPKDVSKHVRVQENIVRSNSSKPTFDLVGGHHHRTNTEVLVDTYAMTKCVSIVHGRSSVSEAVMYINPELIDRNVDLEDKEDQMTVDEFNKLLKIS